MIRLLVIGPLRIVDERGTDCTPRGMRPKAIVAALACAPEFTRSRTFLQDLLWSEREKDRGFDAFRQTLTVIRKALPKQPETEILRSRGGFVSFENSLVLCDPIAEAQEFSQAGSRIPEFAEGLDVSDPVFEDWIRDERSRMETVLAGAIGKTNTRISSAPLVFSVSSSRSAPGEDAASELFMDLFFQGLSDFTRVHVADEKARDEREFNVRAETLGIGEAQRLRSMLFRGESVGNRWSASEKLLGEDDEWDSSLLRLAFRTHEATLSLLNEHCELNDIALAHTLATRAFSKFLDMSGNTFDACDRDFQLAHEMDPRGVFLAYRAFIRTNMVVERRTSDPLAMSEEALNFIRRALNDEPLNGAVNAAASHVSLLLSNDAIAAHRYATRATEINPSNPLGWSSLANALVRQNRATEAQAASQRALQIARLSKFSYWWEMNASLVSAVNQNSEQALRHAIAARATAPNFKPPLRYLIALHFHLGDIEAAANALDELKAIEPDFELRLFDEYTYPAATLRQSSLREIAKISSL